MTIIATAGHVDHGKSSLIRALTGTDPDRLAEEKRRGMTIDLGFAHLHRPDGRTLGFVDVPGHSDFVRTMIAGASGAKVALLVVDAREGWKPQTHEHLAICEMLGLSVGVIALTKTDLVDETRIAEIETDSRRFVADSPIEWVDVVYTSVERGDGIEDLAASLGRAAELADNGTVPDLDRPRLFVDRVFTIAGAGTVVTGSLGDGSLHVGDVVVSVPSQHRATVRSIQVHGEPVQHVRAGTRCAVNLSHTSTMEISRGDALVIAGQWATTSVADVDIRHLAGSSRVLGNGRGWVMHVGTARRDVAIRLLPLTMSSIRVRFDRPLPLSPGDHVVIRHSGSDTTVAGGVVLDAAPLSRVSRATPDGTVESILAGRGWIHTSDATRLTGRRVKAVVGNWVASGEIVEKTAARLSAMLDHGPIDMVALSAPERDIITGLPDVVVELGTARRGRHNPLLEHPSVAAIRDAGVTPPPSSTFDRDVIRRLVAAHALYEHDGIAFHADVLASLQPVLDALWQSNPDGFTVSQLRERLGITRKHAVPLATCLDAARLTRRVGDRRVRPSHGAQSAT